MAKRYTIGLDLGGTNLKGAIVALDGAIAFDTSIETEAARGPDHVIQRMVGLCETLMASAGVSPEQVAGVGIGSPGPLSHKEGLIYKMANLPGWLHVPMRSRVAASTGLPATVDNDANVAALGEFAVGAGKEADDVVLLTLGTGVGGGIVIDGRIHRGAMENGGEIGHTIVEPGGRSCPCGQRGCLERYASASNVAERYIEACTEAGMAPRGAVTSRDVAERVAEGDRIAKRIWDDACRYLAIACVNIQHVLNPDCVLLGGGLANAGATLLDQVRLEFAELTWKLAVDQPRIAIASLGERAGMLGAAELARIEFAENKA